VIDPEELARRAAEAADAEDMAGGQPPSEAERALPEGGAATDEVDVAEAVAAADVEPPPSQGVPGIPPVLAEGLPEDPAAADPEPPPTQGVPGIPPVLAEGVPEAADASAPAPAGPTVEHPAPGAGPAPAEPAPTTPGRGLDELRPHPPGFAVADTPVHGTSPMPHAEDFIERAIESVLEQVPDLGDAEPEGSAKLQPWAETAAPPSKNKRPLSELLDQYAARVAAEPDAVAGRPRGQHPVAAFFARFTPQGGGRRAAEGPAPGGGGSRRRRGRRGAPTGAPSAPQPQSVQPRSGGGRPPRGPRPPQGERGPRPAGQPPAATQDAGAQQRSRRRRRRGRGGGGGGGAPAQG
jgi:translation initiation factor IF-2